MGKALEKLCEKYCGKIDKISRGLLRKKDYEEMTHGEKACAVGKAAYLLFNFPFYVIAKTYKDSKEAERQYKK